MTVSAFADYVDRRPYVGTRPFETDDVNRFFGRTREADELVGLWRTERLTILSGPSGVGRTSLLMAAALPSLDPAQADPLPIGRLTQGTPFPLAALPDHNPYTLALLSSWSPADPPTRLSGLTVHDFLRRRVRRTGRDGRPLPLLAAIDSAEDLFADLPHRDDHRRAFLDELAEAIDGHPNLRLLLSVREDHLPALTGYEPLLGRMSLQRLRALTTEQALAAIRQPLESTHRSFADGVAENLVADLGGTRAAGTIEPALLQLVCSRIWDSLPDEVSKITIEDVETFADVDRTLTGFVGQVLADVAGDHGIPVTGLRTWTQEAFATGTDALREGADTEGMPNAVLHALQDRHLLKAEWRSDARWYLLQHDRLIEPVRWSGLAAPETAAPAQSLRAAELAFAGGELTLAEKHALEAVSGFPETELRMRAQAETLLGNVAHERGALDAAQARYRTAATLYEALQDTAAVGRLLAAIGRLGLAQGRRGEAVQELRAAVQRVPGDLTLRTELARALWQTGQDRAAVSVLTGVLSVDGDTPAALRARGEFLADLGNATEALRDLNRLRTRQPAAQAARGLALATLDDIDAAGHEIDAALAGAPDNGPVLLYAARVGSLSGDTEAAADLARRAVEATHPALPPHQRERALRLLHRDSGT